MQVPKEAYDPTASGKANELIDRVTFELSKIAAVIESVSDSFSPTMELFEAGHAIQTALVALTEWRVAEV